MLSSKNLTKTYPGDFSRSSRFAGDSVLPNDVCVLFAVTKRAIAWSPKASEASPRHVPWCEQKENTPIEVCGMYCHRDRS